MKALYIAGLAALIGCVSGGQTEGGAPADRNVITESELTSVPSSSLYDLIEKVRPHFIQPHGAAVYVDGEPYGDTGQLRSLVAAQVQEVRYYDALRAQQKFGRLSSVIDVTIKRGK